MTAELRAAWTCGTCTVTSRRPAEGAIPLPNKWDRDEEGRPRCFRCGREARREVGELTKEDLSRERSYSGQRQKREEREKKLRAVLLELHPADTAEAIEEAAAITKYSETKVREVRAAMRKEGELPPAPRRAADQALEETVAALERLGGSANTQELADALGVRVEALRHRLLRYAKRGLLTATRGERKVNRGATPLVYALPTRT